MISWKEKALFALALALTIAVLCLTLYAQCLRIEQANQKREVAEGKVTQLTGERDHLTATLTEQRPVLTGAAACREWLSSSNALPAAVDRPAQ